MSVAFQFSNDKKKKMDGQLIGGDEGEITRGRCICTVHQINQRRDVVLTNCGEGKSEGAVKICLSARREP